MTRRLAALLILVGIGAAGCGKDEFVTEVHAPGVKVNVNPDGSSTVVARGVNVKSGPGGASVRAPGVDVQTKP